MSRDLEEKLAATQAKGEQIAAILDRLRQGDHPAITHCDNCGCDWLDNGLNPIGCPYCKQPAAGDEIEYEYEVWQYDEWQAGGREADYASAQSEANHYAMMYAQDGPVEVRIYEKRLLSTDQIQPNRRRYDPYGSLSEYGIFPECDAQQPVAPSEESEEAGVEPLLDSLIRAAYDDGDNEREEFSERVKAARASVVAYVQSLDSRDRQPDAGEQSMNMINDGGFAFPVWELNGNGQPEMTEFGMTLRDYFAARMMVCELAREIRPHESYDYRNAATRAYRMADAMLKVREASNG